MTDYSAQIETSAEILKTYRKSLELFGEEKKILELEKLRATIIYSQIYDYLAPRKKEEEILEQIKGILANDFPVVKIKIETFAKNLKKTENEEDKANLYRYLGEWLQLKDDFMAMVAFRSLEHFALYIEEDKPETGSNSKIWKYSIDPFHDNGWSGCTKGFWYYANQMVIDNKIKFLMKQLPTSFGKTYSDSVLIAFILGYAPDTQIMKVVGNKDLVSPCVQQVIDIMTSKFTRARYLKVFPQFLEGVDEDTKYLVMKRYSGNEKISKEEIAKQNRVRDKLISYMFSICAPSDGMFTLADSGRDVTMRCITKTQDRDGLACTWLFLDDIVQRSEILKIDAHEKDIKAFDGTWKKRCRDEKELRIIVGGTTYDPYDLLVTLKNRYSKGVLKRSKINKYTFLGKDEDAVFVCVPKLDEHDKLTFPQKTVLESVLQDRKNDPELFAAMDMQKPIAPKDAPFYWDSLCQYRYVPSDCTPYALASLDPARTGNNYVSMPICRIRKEMVNGAETEIHYLVDCLYQMLPMDRCYPMICDLVKQHHIVKLNIERNTDTSLKYLLDKLFAENGIDFCEITEVYSTQNKENRIFADETIIKRRIKFPLRDMYSRASQMGTFMEHIISYKYKGAAYDDSIDSIGLYVDKYIRKTNEPKKPKIIYR